MARDPLVKALKQIRRDANRQAQSRDRETSEDGSALWHMADDAVKAARGPRCPSWVYGKGRKP